MSYVDTENVKDLVNLFDLGLQERESDWSLQSLQLLPLCV